LYEAITAARRWNGYALRALLVVAMLIALGVVWLGGVQRSSGGLEADRQFLAKLGENFYYGAAGIQLALALLTAPAATAGAVCIDRARGWLAHMFVTELSDAEIVLGKLSVRFASIVALVLAAVPVLAIVGLVGGIIPEAIVILTVVTLSVALLGCALALALSVRAAKTHEVLMVVFTTWSAWLLSVPLWRAAARSGIIAGPPAWAFKLNPFVLAYAPYAWPGYVDFSDLAIFAGAACLCSVAAVVFAIRRLRVDPSTHAREYPRLQALRRWMRAHLFSWWPSPTLDGNPVLWREWHRNRPSRMARMVTAPFAMGIVLGMVIGIADVVKNGVGVSGEDSLEVLSFLSVSFGLLILSATAPTALTEERARGSLDILLTTPLSTHVIVLGKWWATYRRVLPLLVVPALTGLFVAAASPGAPRWMPPSMLAKHQPPTTSDRLIAGLLPPAFLLAHAAATTSYGLAMATWFQRTGRAVAASVTGFVVFSIGWIVFVAAIIRPLLDWWSIHNKAAPDHRNFTLEQTLIALSPLGGQTAPLDGLANYWSSPRDFIWRVLLQELALVFVIAAVLLGLILLTFNRCLGRMSESPSLARVLGKRLRQSAPAPAVVPAAEVS
jgi:ABC-type transport system involved in multi-copper enzyme maturation permease subunit